MCLKHTFKYIIKFWSPTRLRLTSTGLSCISRFKENCTLELTGKVKVLNGVARLVRNYIHHCCWPSQSRYNEGRFIKKYRSYTLHHNCLSLVMQEGDNWLHFQSPTFSGIDSSYSLPNNTALLTLQVF